MTFLLWAGTSSGVICVGPRLAAAQGALLLANLPMIGEVLIAVAVVIITGSEPGIA